jgi:uncharacterized protein YndB with AHSA1/START domain
LVIVALQPAAYRVSRSATIAAPPAEVFAQVNDLHAMNAWSPWLEPDPQVKLSYDGPPAGTGAAFSWDGNSQVGAGRLTIVDSQPNDRIRIKLDFLRPFASTADAEFTFKTEGDRTIVTWTMSGRKVFMTKLFGLFMSMDKMIGGHFEKGLATMKSRVEGSVKA